MANEHNWIIENLEYEVESNKKPNVVFNIHWRCNASDGEHVSTITGAQRVQYSKGAAFTPFEQLTKDQVLVWLRDAMTQDRMNAIEKSLDDDIEFKTKPIIKSGLPWGQ
jgi:hypothetical protein